VQEADEGGRLFAESNFPASQRGVNAVLVGGGAIFTEHFTAQSAQLASESSYRSSIREPAIRQPPELLLEMERPGYNGVQRPTFESQILAWRGKVDGGGRETGLRDLRVDGSLRSLGGDLSRHFVAFLISFARRPQTSSD
jgi:hypothetical protein